MDKVKFVLASNSPRRRQLFGLGGWEFTVIVADVDETPFEHEAPRDYVVRLAQAKASAVQPKAGLDAVILGSDTTVVDGNEILGKPVDESDAWRMLKQLRGRTHQVYTAIAILQHGKMYTDLSIIDVPMREYSDQEIDTYIKTGDPMDKAGAYAIQHPEFKPVSSLEGCRAGVMGLPMCHVVRTLKHFNISSFADVPSACQSLLQYDCKVSPLILSGEIVN
ncbi:MAG TPA: Maf family protein [Anaerolineales bacterium]|nr:Maf family protein [Anaerolineales bacterium]HNO93113.1 Maf family protein [Anaerolineales bacterium]